MRRKKRSGLLLSVPQTFFQMKVNESKSLETKSLDFVSSKITTFLWKLSSTVVHPLCKARVCAAVYIKIFNVHC